MKKRVLATTFAALALLCSCNNCKTSQIELIDSANFQTTIDNREVSLYTLSNESGITMQVTNFGARIINLYTPDKRGEMEDIVLGYNTIGEYLNNAGERFLGATIGRYGNRIADGKFTLNGEEYTLSTYNNGQCLHGGDKGYDMVVWDVVKVSDDSIEFSYISADMEEGFPGELRVGLTYTLTPQNELRVEHSAVTDKPTVVNLTHHSFFNLKGEGNGTINDHIMTIAASGYTPVNESIIPTGVVESVESTPFDFRAPKLIGRDLSINHQQFDFCGGYDHNWVLDRKSESGVEFAASVWEPTSGRYMEVWTSEPAIQFYGGNFFDGAAKGKSGKEYSYRESFALETQHYPDSPNQPSFPSTTLNPGESYSHTCIYKFSTK